MILRENMNKQLLLVLLVAVLFAACRGRGRSRDEIVIEDVKYQPLVTDSAAIDSIANSGLVDEVAPMEVPDIPKDSEVDMNATDEAAEEIMTGGGDGGEG